MSDNYAYLAAAGAGLRIINVSNPSSPREVGSYDTPDFAYEVAVVGSAAFVADGIGGMIVIDVSNPGAPRQIATLAGVTRGICISASLSYLAATTLTWSPL